MVLQTLLCRQCDDTIHYYGVMSEFFTVKIMITYYNSYYLQLETKRIYEVLEVEEI